MENKPKIRVFTRSLHLATTKPKKSIHDNWLNDKTIELGSSTSVNDNSKQLNYFYNLRQ